MGEVIETVKPIGEFEVSVNGSTRPILEVDDLVAPDMGHDVGDAEKQEYVVRVEWEKAYPKDQAWWETGLFANQNTAAKLRDTDTIRRLEEHFGVNGTN